MGVSLHGLDDPYISVGGELSGYSHRFFAIDGGFSFGFNVNESIGFGTRFFFGHNFDTVVFVEGAGLFRYNLPATLSLGYLVLETQVGISVLFEDNETFLKPMGGASFLWRFPITGSFFMEPFIRAGYPYIWAAGFMVGMGF